MKRHSTGSGAAFGEPGIEPRWTRGDKDAVGTAYSSSSRVWFTMSSGMLNEVYYPTLDKPQIRDLQYLITDGESFFHDERRHLDATARMLSNHALGYSITSVDREGRYSIIKEVIADPHYACVLIRTRLEAEEPLRSRLRLFALLAPHLEMGGYGNSGCAVESAGSGILVAHKGATWLALGASIPFVGRSCGYVGRSDGWTDLADNFQMDWAFDAADDGNIALTGELDLQRGHEFTLGLAFGSARHDAVATLMQSLGTPFADHRERFIAQWERICKGLRSVKKKASGDGGRLYRTSNSLLLSHEDKTYPGAMIASLSIPWGEVRGDNDIGGYHLVWTRDMVNSATGLLAAGNTETPLRSLIYLACSQLPDGGFHQNFWINGDPHWTGVQLDEVAFPIILSWRLHEAGALRDFDPYPMVLRAASYLVRLGRRRLRSAGRRTADTRRPLWLPVSQRSYAQPASRRCEATPPPPTSSSSTPTSSSVTSSHGRSRPKGRSRRTSADTTSGSIRLMSVTLSRTRTRTPARCTSETARPGRRIDSPPKRSWMRDSLNWCATACARGAIL